MRRILCFGDSNTWGYSPDGITRYDSQTRWPGVMRQKLGEAYTVIEEGHCGRTTVYNDPEVPGRNGSEALPEILRRHAPLDLVIIMLGTNDHKICYKSTPRKIAENIDTLIHIIREHEVVREHLPEILVIAPLPLVHLPETLFKESFAGSEQRSEQTGREVMAYFAESGVHLFNAAAYITTSSRDGLHLEPAEQIRLGGLLAAAVEDIFSGE